MASDTKHSFYYLTAVISTVLVLVVGELLVRMVVPAEKLWLVGKSNIYAVAEIPEIGYTYQANMDRNAFGVDLKTNKLGFRGPDWQNKKMDDTFRIVLIGDSHAFGFGVPFENTVGEVLSDSLGKRVDRKIEVLNFGVSGHNSRQELGVFQQYAVGFQPDLVVLMLSGNDHEASRWVDEDGWLYRQRRSTGAWTRVFDRSNQVGEPWRFPRWMRHSHLALYLGVVVSEYQVREKQFMREKSAASASSKSWNAKVHGFEVSLRLQENVYQPVREIIRQSSVAKVPVVLAYYAKNTDYLKMINRLERDENIVVVDLLSVFPEVHNAQELAVKFGLGWNPHINSEGHRRWAHAIADVVQKNGYLERD